MIQREVEFYEEMIHINEKLLKECRSLAEELVHRKRIILAKIVVSSLKKYAANCGHE